MTKTLTEELQEKAREQFNSAKETVRMSEEELNTLVADLIQTVLKRVEGEIDKTDFYDWNSQTQKMIKDRIKQEAIIRLQQSDK